MKTEKNNNERYFVFNLGFADRGRQVARFGDLFFELEDISKYSGKPKKKAKPVKLKPYEKIKSLTA